METSPRASARFRPLRRPTLAALLAAVLWPLIAYGGAVYSEPQHEDTWVSENEPDAVLGDEPVMYAKNYWEDIAPRAYGMAFVKFPVPLGATVTSAELRLPVYSTAFPVHPDTFVWVDIVSSNWSQNQLTYNLAGEVSEYASAVAYAVVSQLPIGGDAVFEIPAADINNAISPGDTEISFRLKVSPGSDAVSWVGFNTSEFEPPRQACLTLSYQLTPGPAVLPGEAMVTCNLTAGSSGGRVVRLDAQTGAMLHEFGMTTPRCVTLGPDGSVYLASANTHRVYRYDLSAGTLSEFAAGGGLQFPWGLAFGPDGDLYVSSRFEVFPGVLRFDGETGAYRGVAVEPAAIGYDVIPAIAFGDDGNLYLARALHGDVQRYRPGTGDLIDVFVASGSGGLGFITGMTFGPDGNLYLSSEDKDAVFCYDGVTGQFLGIFCAVDHPEGLRFAPDGDLYVCSGLTDRVCRFDGATAEFEGILVAGIDAPMDIVFIPAPPTICPLVLGALLVIRRRRK